MKVLTKIKDIATLITSVTIVVGILWGVFKFVDKDTTQSEILNEIKSQQLVIIDSITVLSQKMYQFDGQLEAVNDNTILIGNYVERVDKAVRETARTQQGQTLEQYSRIIEILEGEKKKPIAQK